MDKPQKTQFEMILGRVETMKHTYFCEALNEISKLFVGMDKSIAQTAYALANETRRIENSNDLTQEGRRNAMRAVSEPFEIEKARYQDATLQARKIIEEITPKIIELAQPRKDTGENRLPNIELWKMELESATHEEMREMYGNNANDTDFMRIFNIFAKNSDNARMVQTEAKAHINKAAYYKRVDELKGIIHNVHSTYLWEIPTILNLMKEADFTREGMPALPLTNFERLVKWETIPGFVEHTLL